MLLVFVPAKPNDSAGCSGVWPGRSADLIGAHEPS